jgi:hypothetical protein
VLFVMFFNEEVFLYDLEKPMTYDKFCYSFAVGVLKFLGR